MPGSGAFRNWKRYSAGYRAPRKTSGWIIIIVIDPGLLASTERHLEFDAFDAKSTYSAVLGIDLTNWLATSLVFLSRIIQSAYLATNMSALSCRKSVPDCAATEEAERMISHATENSATLNRFMTIPTIYYVIL